MTPTLLSRVTRWRRPALAVLALLALLASAGSVLQAVVGARCLPATAANLADAPSLSDGREVSRAALVHPSHDVTTEIPASPAALVKCGPTVATVPVATVVPTAGTTVDPKDPPSGRYGRPLSFAPPPPFHPPRAI